MAYITPKTDWTAVDVVQSSDLNRVEGNIAQNRADYQAADSAEASARIAGDSAEASARASADSALDLAKLNNKTMGSRTMTTGSINGGESYTIPAGAYYYKLQSAGGQHSLEIRNSVGTWVLFNSAGTTPKFGLVISDGLNARFAEQGATPDSTSFTLLRIDT